MPIFLIESGISTVSTYLLLENTQSPIADSIKKIGKGAFYNCVKLQSITIPEGVTALSANTFEKCLYLEEVNLGSQLKSIGDEAFYDCRRLRTLDIPASVTEIGEEAFTNIP